MNTSGVMFLEQVCCSDLRGDKKANTIPGKLEEGKRQSRHNKSILKFEGKGQKGLPHSLCTESLHYKLTGLNSRGLFAEVQILQLRACDISSINEAICDLFWKSYLKRQDKNCWWDLAEILSSTPRIKII